MDMRADRKFEITRMDVPRMGASCRPFAAEDRKYLMHKTRNKKAIRFFRDELLFPFTDFVICYCEKPQSNGEAPNR